MLSITLANQELRAAIEQLTQRPWTNSEATTENYVDALLKILIEFKPPKTVLDPTQLLTETKKVDLLRHRLTGILNIEKTLNLNKENCDIVFNIQLALARAYPTNVYLNTEEPEEYDQPTWQDPASFDLITREMQDIIIFSNADAQTKATVARRYHIQDNENSTAYDNQRQPKGLDNKILSAREIASLIKQGIDLKVPSQDSLGRKIGRNVSHVLEIIFTMSTMVMAYVTPLLFCGRLVFTLAEASHFLIDHAFVSYAVGAGMMIVGTGVITIGAVVMTYALTNGLAVIVNATIEKMRSACADLGGWIEIKLRHGFQFLKQIFGYAPTPPSIIEDQSELDLSSQARILSVIQTPVERLVANVTKLFNDEDDLVSRNTALTAPAKEKEVCCAQDSPHSAALHTGYDRNTILNPRQP